MPYATYQAPMARIVVIPTYKNIFAQLPFCYFKFYKNVTLTNVTYFSNIDQYSSGPRFAAVKEWEPVLSNSDFYSFLSFAVADLSPRS